MPFLQRKNMENIWTANIIGAVIIPITIYQFALSKTKKGLLLSNFLSSSIWGISLLLTLQYDAGIISILAGIASLSQHFLQELAINEKKKNALKFLAFFSVFVLAYFLYKPVNFFDFLPFIAFSYMRFIEMLPNIFLRFSVIPTPIAWAFIAYHGGNYSLIIPELIAIGSMLYWLYQNQYKEKRAVIQG